MVLALFLLLQFGFVAWTATSPQRHAAWQTIIPTPFWPAFADLRIVANGWSESAANFDPLRTDGDAPSYNYPRLWMLGEKIGWRAEDATWLGILTAALFLGSVLAVMRIAPGWTRLLALGLLASPAVGMGLERGNSDLLIFAIATPALLAGVTGLNGRSWGSVSLITLASMLKLYPIVFLPACVVRAGRAAWISAAIGVLVFSGYLLVTHNDVAAILAKTERGTAESYGLAFAAKILSQNPVSPQQPSADETVTIGPESQGPQRTARWITAGLLLAAMAATRSRQSHAIPRRKQENIAPLPEAALRLFLAGAATFLVTFLFAQSWAYRLLFLIWTLPWLGHELSQGVWSRRVLAAITLVLIGTICWFIPSESPTAQWWAHGTCFALMTTLAFLVGKALEMRTKEAPAIGLSPKWIGVAAILVTSGILVGSEQLSSLTPQGVRLSNLAETWQLVQRGKIAVQNGQTATAIAHLEAALRLDSNHADARAHLGAALWQAGRSPEALQHLQQAITLQPRAIRARNTLAGIRRQQRNWSEAITGYRESLAIRPDDIATLNQLGLTYLESGRPDEAQQWLEQAQKLRPDHPETARNLGIVSVARGRIDEATEHFKRALQLKPDYADAALQWGFTLARAGRLPEALEHFQLAVKLAPESGRAHFVLAMALRELGRLAEGEAHYREAIRLDPSLARP